MAVLPLPAYIPVYPVTKTVKPRQRVTKLPSWGIEQRKTEGLNQTAPEWSVKWILSPAEANDLDAFLAERARVGEWFLWLPPSGVSGMFRCDDWSKQVSSCSIYEVQATFRQVFDASADDISTDFLIYITTSFAGGAASAFSTTTGFALSLDASFVGGAAGSFVAATGFALSVAASFAGGAAVGSADAVLTGFALSVDASIAAGGAEGGTDVAATGFALSVNASFEGGAASAFATATGFALSVAVSFTDSTEIGYYEDWITQTYGFEADIYPSWWAS